MIKKNKSHQYSSKTETYLKNLFTKREIPYSEADLGLASQNLIKFFRLLYETAVQTKDKPKQEMDPSVKNAKKPEYSPVYMNQYRIKPQISEFMSRMTKEQIMDICFTIDEFKKHKEQTNLKYKKMHAGMTKEYKEFLLWK